MKISEKKKTMRRGIKWTLRGNPRIVRRGRQSQEDLSELEVLSVPVSLKSGRGPKKLRSTKV